MFHGYYCMMSLYYGTNDYNHKQEVAVNIIKTAVLSYNSIFLLEYTSFM